MFFCLIFMVTWDLFLSAVFLLLLLLSSFMIIRWCVCVRARACFFLLLAFWCDLSISFPVNHRYRTTTRKIYSCYCVDLIVIIIRRISLASNMEGDVVLLGLMDWNAAASSATQFIPLPTTTEVCYELLTGGVRIYTHTQRMIKCNYAERTNKRSKKNIPIMMKINTFSENFLFDLVCFFFRRRQHPAKQRDSTIPYEHLL